MKMPQSVELERDEKMISSLCSNLSDKQMMVIFASFGSFHEILKVRRVCRRWRSLVDKFFASQKVLDLKAVFGDESRAPDEPETCLAILRIVISKCSGLNVLDIGSFTSCYNFSVQPRWEYEEDGQFMMKVGHFAFGDGDLQMISEKCPKLRVLRLSWLFETISDEGLRFVQANCNNLEQLELDDCWNVSGRYFHLFNQQIKQLSCVETTVNPEMIVSQLLKGPARSALQTLYLGLAEGGSSLEALRKGEEERVDYAAILQELCGSFHSLKQLSWDFRLHSEHSAQNIANLHNLEALDLKTDTTALTDVAFTRIMRSCPKMKRCALELYRESDVFLGLTDDGLKQMPIYWPHVLLLSLRNMPHVTDKSIFKILTECHSIEMLRIDDSPLVTIKTINCAREIAAQRVAFKIKLGQSSSFEENPRTMKESPREKVLPSFTDEEFDEKLFETPLN